MTGEPMDARTAIEAGDEPGADIGPEWLAAAQSGGRSEVVSALRGDR